MVKKNDFEKNVLALQSADLNVVESAIKLLGFSRNRRAVPILMAMLEDAKDVNIKNALALSLGNLKANDAVPLLIKLIKAPENKNRVGSFVYALQSLDCKKYFLDIVDLICTGNYEVYDHALQVFESTIDDVSYNDKLAAKQALEKQKRTELSLPPSKHPQYDRIHFINNALKMCED